MKIDNKMPDSFFGWLSACPVQWHLGQWDKESVVILLFLQDEEDNEEGEE